MENILISSCLLGVACRWHGKKCYKSGFVKKFIDNNTNIEVIGVCPEVLGGLGVPRNPVKRIKGKVFETCPEKENRKYVTGKERTDEFNRGAEEVLKIAKSLNVKTAILCKYSPSCDISGLTGKLLSNNGIEIINTF